MPCVVPLSPLSELMPDRLGCEINCTEPLAAIASASVSAYELLNLVRSFSLPANTLALDAMPIIFGLISLAASKTRSYSAVGSTLPLLTVASTASWPTKEIRCRPSCVSIPDSVTP